jgi:hypothetical protein
LDGDGVIEILIEDSVLEGGLGRESFLTWYAFFSDGSGGTAAPVNGEAKAETFTVGPAEGSGSPGAFKEIKTANIVRSLNAFFRTLAEAWTWSPGAFLQAALEPSPRPTGPGDSPAAGDEVFQNFFSAVPGAVNDEVPFFPQNLIFPAILESPFVLEDAEPVCTFLIRASRGQEDRVYQGRVRLNLNPLSPRRFVLLSVEKPPQLGY